MCRNGQKVAIKETSQNLKTKPHLIGSNFRHVHFTIEENNIGYVADIIIKGNEKTKDNVIRREIYLKKGQRFNASSLNISRQKLLQLQYFKDVRFNLRPAIGYNKLNIIVEVEEQATGNISLGGAYSDTSGFSIYSELSEKNFLGRGEIISGRLRVGASIQTIGIDYNIPWFYDACKKHQTSYWKELWMNMANANGITDIRNLALNFKEKKSSNINRILKYLEQFTKEVRSIEELDAIKVAVRSIIRKSVIREERCYIRSPKPWSLQFGVFSSTELRRTAADRNIQYRDYSGDPFESSVETYSLTINSYYREQRVGFSIGTSHRLGGYWSHYHVYSPTFTTVSNVINRDPDLHRLEDLGTRVNSSLRNGLIFSSIDNGFNPTKGVYQKFEFEMTGSYLGGDSHFNRYTSATQFYFPLFDLSFGGRLKNKALRRWKIVTEFTLSFKYTEKTAPVFGEQIENASPFISSRTDGLYVGGVGTSINYGRLRGYNTFTGNNNLSLPLPWQDGSHHSIFFGPEIRIPFEPNWVWLVIFLDGAALFENVNYYSDIERNELEEYYREGTYESSPVPHISDRDWNDPRRFDINNLNINQFLFSWGFGLRLQIPVLPLRLYFSKKLYPAKNGIGLKEFPNQGWTFEFSIGDLRF